MSRKRVDLTGQVFGRLTVLEYSHSVRTAAHWRCQCSCGNQTTVASNSLRRGLTLSCGCLQRELAGRPAADLTGQRFGRLVAMHQVKDPAKRGAHWLCQCDCGNTPIVRGASLRSGNTRSCGCLRLESLPKTKSE